MRIHGFQKLTLLDYPGKVACTVFTGGCNFRCPFCHNGNLVLHPDSEPLISEEEVFAVLEKRRKVLDGVCVTGGEPTLAPDLGDFIRKVRQMGYLVKLDTNGYRPDVLRRLLEEGLLDYVAMDIKNAPGRYARTAGLDEIDLLKIDESVELLKHGTVDYEFRTTVMMGVHRREEFEVIGRWLAGAKRYALQGYKESEFVIAPGFAGYAREQLEQFKKLLEKDIQEVLIRGV